MGQTMSFYQSEPVAEDKHWSMQEEALKRAGLAEAERMAKRTAEREASAQGQPLDEDEERQRRAIAAEVNVIAPGGSPNTSPMFGEPLLGEPGEYYCCQRAADHILSAICRGYVHLLTVMVDLTRDENGCLHAEASAKTGMGVVELFQSVADKLPEPKAEEDKRSFPILPEPEPAKSSGCC